MIGAVDKMGKTETRLVSRVQNVNGRGELSEKSYATKPDAPTCWTSSAPSPPRPSRSILHPEQDTYPPMRLSAIYLSVVPLLAADLGSLELTFNYMGHV